MTIRTLTPALPSAWLSKECYRARKQTPEREAVCWPCGADEDSSCGEGHWGGRLKDLVSWCFEPSQTQRITPGLNTNFSLSPSYSFHKSLYHKSFFPQTTAQSLSAISECKTKKTNTCFGAYLYSASTQHGNLQPAGWPILFCGLTQKLVLATANTGKTQRRFWKKCRWMD